MSGTSCCANSDLCEETGLGLSIVKGTSFMWRKHVWGFNGNLSKVDLFAVCSHTVGRSFISVLRVRWEVVNTTNCFREMTLEQYHYKHGMRPELDVLCITMEHAHYNYIRFNWITIIFSDKQISMLTFSIS